MKRHTHKIYTIVTQDTYNRLKSEVGKGRKYSTVTNHVMNIIMQYRGDKLITDYTYRSAGIHTILLSLTQLEHDKIMSDFAISGQDSITQYVRNVINSHFINKQKIT